MGEKYIKAIIRSKDDFEDCGQIQGLFDHFPRSISNKLFIKMTSRIPTIKVYNPVSIYSASLLLFLDMEKDSEKYYPNTFIYKTQYDRLNFIIDDSFSNYQYTDTLKTRNIVLSGAFPIPYFEHSDFDLGFERIDIRDSGINLIKDKYDVQEELEVYVLKAGCGNFWEIEFEQDCPETIGN